MTIDEFLTYVEDIQPPAPEEKIAALEHDLGSALPADYREFLVRSNGGYVGGALWFQGVAPNGQTADAGVHHVGGFRPQSYFSIPSALETYRGRIPE